MSRSTDELFGGHVHIDGVSGAAGDMLLAALIDCGVPLEVVEQAIARCDAALTLRTAEVVKHGVRAFDVKVLVGGEVAETHADLGGLASDGDHGGHAHHNYKDIVARIEGAGLDAAVTARALDVFARVARAEAALHATDIDHVAFHELGAADAIADIVGCSAAFEWLGPAAVTCPGVVTGEGGVGTSHGVLPVPSPAALAILAEVSAPTRGGHCQRELLTPTGAALLASVVTSWTSMPSVVPMTIGYGAGDLDLDDRPNVVRVTVGRGAAAAAQDSAFLLEANLDDMSAELCGYVAETLMARGALDVWFTGITMKKSRPGVLLSVLSPPGLERELTALVMAETTTLGVRHRAVERTVLEREVVRVETEYGPVTVKVGRGDSGVLNAAPEYESCAAVARDKGVALKEVYAAAIAAYRARG